MDLSNLTDRDLVALIVGKAKAKRLYKGSLASLLDTNSPACHASLLAAHEFVMRALREELPRRDCLENPYLVRNYLRTALRSREHEVFVVIYLDARNRVIRHEELFRGTHDHASVYPREVLKSALQNNASSLIIAHNHPSGDPKPSVHDVAVTVELIDALKHVDVRVHDHILIAGNECVSFAERGLIK